MAIVIDEAFLPAHASRKNDEWIDNGAQVAWLIDPETRAIEIYRLSRDPETVTSDTVSGEGPVEGFVLQLPRVWNSLAGEPYSL